MKTPQRVDLAKVRTAPVAKTRRLISLTHLARIPRPERPLHEFLSGLPRLQAAARLQELAGAIVRARARQRPVLLMLGAHVIKCGLSPVLIDLMRERVITALALNGAGAIHDFEMALFGCTSEDVAKGLADGSFGMARETGAYMNEAICLGAERGEGMGESLGRMVMERKAPYRQVSLLGRAWQMKVPLTVHVGIGTDIIHQHPSADGAALGKTSFDDFRLLAGIVSQLEGGVVLNVGSAVILPEVFLKALSISRNLGHRVRKFCAANFDQIQHYRPNENVVRRPTLHGGRGYTFTGHHEIMIPLMAAAIKTKLRGQSAKCKVKSPKSKVQNEGPRRTP